MNQILAGHLNFEGGIKQGETASLPLSRGNTLCLSNKHISVCTQTDSSIGYSDLMFRVFKSAWKDSLYGEEIGIFFSFPFFCFFLCQFSNFTFSSLYFFARLSVGSRKMAIVPWINVLDSDVYSTGGEPDPRPGHRLLHPGEELYQRHPGVQSPLCHELRLLQPIHLCFAA